MSKNRLGRYIYLALCASCIGMSGAAEGQVELPTVSVTGYPIGGLGPGGGGFGGGGFQETGQQDVYVENPGNNIVFRDAATGDPPCDNGSNPSHANPIVLSTGNKIEADVDFVSYGDMPLTLEHTYDRYLGGVEYFGLNHLSSFDYHLVNGGMHQSIFVHGPDGRNIEFVWSGVGERYNEKKASPIAYLTKNTDSSYTVHTEDMRTAQFDHFGYILSLKNAQGIGWTYTYNGAPTIRNLYRVTHTSGRYVEFTYSGGLQPASVRAPDGSVFYYTYIGNPNYPGRLGTVTGPSVTSGLDSTRIEYIYEIATQPDALTGKAYQGSRSQPSPMTRKGGRP